MMLESASAPAGAMVAPAVPATVVSWAGHRKLLEVTDLEKRYSLPGRTVTAVDKVSFEVFVGEVVVLLGKNGAGKTTTMKMILGLIAPDSGRIVQHGADQGAGQFAGATLEGGRNLYWRLTPQENLEYYGVLRGLSARQARLRAQALMERFELGEHRAKLIQKLSRGLQQRVALAVALIHSPSLLVLDEPTLGVDYEGTQILLDIIRELRRDGIGTLISTHQLGVAEAISDRTIILRDGAIAADRATAELLLEIAGNQYEIDVAAPLAPFQVELLSACGARVEQQRISVGGDAPLLAKVLQAIGQTPLVRMAQVNATLEAAYRKYTR